MTLSFCLSESLSRSESKMRSMEEALEKAQGEAKLAKDELKKLKKTLDTYKKEATEAFDKAKEHTRKVEDGFRGLVNKISGDFLALGFILRVFPFPFS